MGSKISMSVLFFVSLSHFVSLNIGVPLAPALYILGDSILDSGNNNNLSTTAKVNYLPYGSKFKLGPTGRFTNGKTIADFVAEYLGLPYVPPVMGLRDRNITTEKDLPRLIPNKELPKYLANSIMIFSVGSNDYINNYLRPEKFNSSRIFNPEQYAKLLNDRLSKDLQRVYHMGFRKIIVFALGPIGCVPAIRDLTSHTGPCVTKVNQYVARYNIQLAASLLKLTASLKGSTFVLGGGSAINITGKF
ncbi:GDSL lipase/esterase [Dillenia turbinata]|uniref:GDSL lipase/esterase n=1 Tax=Dillenia turbinata TaxID=194707 RepID=A0AAN8V5U0_9MAGN